jgi:hypothetical protein
MGLKDRNNPLGQRTPSGKVGATSKDFKHEQSAELVDQVRKKADDLQKKKDSPSKENESSEYDISGPKRQPGKIAKQSELGKQRSKLKKGEYTQDNEEEGPYV